MSKGLRSSKIGLINFYDITYIYATLLNFLVRELWERRMFGVLGLSYGLLLLIFMSEKRLACSPGLLKYEVNLIQIVGTIRIIVFTTTLQNYNRCLF